MSPALVLLAPLSLAEAAPAVTADDGWTLVCSDEFGGAVLDRSEWSITGSTNPGAPFDRPFHLIQNLAIGGHLPEGRNGGGVRTGGFPKTMAVDWVRVWQRIDGIYAGACSAFEGDKGS
jgi:hypothetical protein